ncbi:hypothetical protein GCM10009565_08980 [Amycolatopsis albidoflavus]
MDQTCGCSVGGSAACDCAGPGVATDQACGCAVGCCAVSGSAEPDIGAAETCGIGSCAAPPVGIGCRGDPASAPLASPESGAPADDADSPVPGGAGSDAGPSVMGKLLTARKNRRHTLDRQREKPNPLPAGR